MAEVVELETILIPNTETKLQNTNLTENNNKQLTEEKTRLQTKLTDSQLQIQKIVQKIKIVQELDSLEKEMKEENENPLKTLLKTRQEQLQTQLDILFSTLTEV
ncbi:hypothetical protein [Candidatus Phytoplasma fraxini]|uniref:Uncharacterized protein n=1 Tax=Ash yellows phytoplasma TaxID=35780 RepID=A0ABZ2U8D8_ASHYP